MSRQYNRLTKELGTLEAVSDETQELYDFMRQLIGKVEGKGQLHLKGQLSRRTTRI